MHSRAYALLLMVVCNVLPGNRHTTCQFAANPCQGYALPLLDVVSRANLALNV
jgi:hypothetical protein